jgi:hypothetical protein
VVKPHDDPVSCPISYLPCCLGEDGALLAAGGGEVAIPKIPPGGTERFAVAVLGCPLSVVAANGLSA